MTSRSAGSCSSCIPGRRLRGAMRLVVVKLGSSIVAADDGELRMDVLERVADAVAGLRREGAEVIVVTSAAIALGMRVVELPARPAAIDELQAASAVGQGKLYRAHDGRLLHRHVGGAPDLPPFFHMHPTL